MDYTTTVDGEPIAKGRPRFTNRGNYNSAYTPKKTLDAEKHVRLSWQHPTIYEECVSVSCEFVMSRAQSHYNSKGELNKQGLSHPYPDKKPDIDNLSKLILDALNKTAYEDDKQVMELHAYKRYAQGGEQPYTKVVIGVLEHPALATVSHGSPLYSSRFSDALAASLYLRRIA